MKRIKIITLLLMAFLSVFLYLLLWPSKADSKVIKGVFDAQMNLTGESIVTLDGEWEFYWQELLTPEDFEKDNALQPQYVYIPSSWSRVEDTTNFGFGTYRIILNNLVPGEKYGLTKKNIRIASVIYIDDKLLSKDGTVAENGSDEVMGNMPKTICFTAQGTTAEVVIQVSDFEYYSGGIVESIKFGTFSNIEDEYQKSMIFETGIFSTLLVIGVIFTILIIFFPEFRKREIAGFFFPITVFAFAIVNGALSERIIKVIFKSMSTEFLIRTEYAAVGILFIALFCSIHFMEKKLLSKGWLFGLSSVYGMLVFMSLFVSLKANYIWNIITFLTIAVLPLLFIYAIVRFIFNKNLSISIEEHIFILAILYTMNLYNLDILLFTFGYKKNINFALLSATFYALIWFFLMAYRVYVANIKLQDTESDLMVSNMEIEVHRNEIMAAYEHLEMVVEERTRDLQKANELLKKEIEKRQKNEGEIEHLAFYDHLTNIPNRRYFTDYFEKELINAKRYKNAISLLFMDLDGFKKVNDSFGHDTGDKLLQMVAERLSEQVRAGDFVARLGGDEFVILLQNLDERKTIERICKDIIKSISEKMDVYGHQIEIGISIGISSYPKDGNTRDMLINKADMSMYESKKMPESSYTFSED